MFCSSSSLFIKIIKLHNTWEMIMLMFTIHIYLMIKKSKYHSTVWNFLLQFLIFFPSLSKERNKQLEKYLVFFSLGDFPSVSSIYPVKIWKNSFEICAYWISSVMLVISLARCLTFTVLTTEIYFNKRLCCCLFQQNISFKQNIKELELFYFYIF